MDISYLLTSQDPPTHQPSLSPQSRPQSSNSQQDHLSPGRQPAITQRRRAPPSPLRQQQRYASDEQQQPEQSHQHGSITRPAGRRRPANVVVHRRVSQSLLSPMDLSVASPDSTRTQFSRNSAVSQDIRDSGRKKKSSSSMAHRPAMASAMDTLAGKRSTMGHCDKGLSC